MRAALYARVSGDDTGKEGRNLAGQLDMCREYAQEQGWEIVAELAEDERGVSGADWDAPQLNKALDMAEQGTIDVLVVRQMDRLAREMGKLLFFERQFEKAGARIAYVLEQFDASPEGHLFKLMKAALADYERLEIARRLTRARRNKVKAGHIIAHGRPPYGYRLKEINGKRSFVVQEEEAEIVRRIFQMYAGTGEDDPLTLFEIAEQLSDEGVLTQGDKDDRQYKKRGRGKWNRRSINKILHSEAYIGTWYYGKTRMVDTKGGKKKQVRNPRQHWIPVDVPAIVDRELWEAAQVQQDANKHRGGPRPTIQFLVQRRARCASCGKAIAAVTKRRNKNGQAVAYYYCPADKYAEFARVCDSRGYWRTDETDAAIWGWLRDLLSDPRAVIASMREEQASREDIIKPLRDRLETIAELVAENKQKRERALQAYLDGTLGDDLLAMLKENAARIDRVLGDLERERAELEARISARAITDQQIESVVEYAESLSGWLEEADRDFAKRRALVERINLTAEFEISGGQRIINLTCDAGYGPVQYSTPSIGNYPRS